MSSSAAGDRPGHMPPAPPPRPDPTAGDPASVDGPPAEVDRSPAGPSAVEAPEASVRDAARRRPLPPFRTPSTPATPGPSAVADLQRALGSRSALRRAVLLREVLDAPVSLRRGHRDVPGGG